MRNDYGADDADDNGRNQAEHYRLAYRALRGLAAATLLHTLSAEGAPLISGVVHAPKQEGKSWILYLWLGIPQPEGVSDIAIKIHGTFRKGKCANYYPTRYGWPGHVRQRKSKLRDRIGFATALLTIAIARSG